MNGQWIGSYTGTSGGQIVVNIDQRESFYQGVAYLNETDHTIPNTACYFRIEGSSDEFNIRTDFMEAIDPRTGIPEPRSIVQGLYGEGITMSGSFVRERGVAHRRCGTRRMGRSYAFSPVDRELEIGQARFEQIDGPGCRATLTFSVVARTTF